MLKVKLIKRKRLGTIWIMVLTVVILVLVELLGWSIYHYTHETKTGQSLPTTPVVCNCPNIAVGSTDTPGPGPCHCP